MGPQRAADRGDAPLQRADRRDVAGAARRTVLAEQRREPRVVAHAQAAGGAGARGRRPAHQHSSRASRLQAAREHVLEGLEGGGQLQGLGGRTHRLRGGGLDALQRGRDLGRGHPSSVVRDLHRGEVDEFRDGGQCRDCAARRRRRQRRRLAQQVAEAKAQRGVVSAGEGVALDLQRGGGARERLAEEEVVDDGAAVVADEGEVAGRRARDGAVGEREPRVAAELEHAAPARARPPTGVGAAAAGRAERSRVGVEVAGDEDERALLRGLDRERLQLVDREEVVGCVRAKRGGTGWDVSGANVQRRGQAHDFVDSEPAEAAALAALLQVRAPRRARPRRRRRRRRAPARRAPAAGRGGRRGSRASAGRARRRGGESP